MVDSSSSVNANWDELLRFVDAFIESLPLGKTALRLGMVQFATKALKVGEFTSSKSVARRNTLFINKGALGLASRIDRGIDAALDMFKDTERHRARVLLGITDGLPSDGIAPGGLADSTFARAAQEGVHVHMVVVDQHNVLQANPMPPAWYTTLRTVGNFSELEGHVPSISNGVKEIQIPC